MGNSGKFCNLPHTGEDVGYGGKSGKSSHRLSYWKSSACQMLTGKLNLPIFEYHFNPKIQICWTAIRVQADLFIKCLNNCPKEVESEDWHLQLESVEQLAPATQELQSHLTVQAFESPPR